MSYLHILQPGLLMTVQDMGRPHMRRWGVPVSGALDRSAHWLTNRLVGNPPTCATLEITMGGCALSCTALTLAALGGADCQWTLDEAPLRPWQAFVWRPGRVLRGRQPRTGVRSYLALSGGVAVPPVLGSRSTLLHGPLPAPLNRPLRSGDRLPLTAAPDLALAGTALLQPPQYPPSLMLRTTAGLHAPPRPLSGSAWQIAAASNRMGYRLSGPPLLPAPPAIASLGVAPGAIQLLPDGQPIILLADAQTTGGYPVIGMVPMADLDRLAQTGPGNMLTFIHIESPALPHIHTTYQALLTAPFEQSDDDWSAPI